MSSTTVPNSSHHRGLPAAPTTPTRKPLSCTSCRQRKIKCDKADPCKPCLNFGIQCTFPTRRIRAPRAKGNALEARDAELLRRIAHLEGMLANKVDTGHARPDDGGSGGKSRTLVSPLASPNILGDGNQADPTLNDHFAVFLKQQGSSARYLNQEFWSSLSDEFDGLRQLINGDVYDEDDFDDSPSYTAEIPDSSPSFIFQDSDSFIDLEVIYPSAAHIEILFRFYFANVDPVCKILHRPTVNTYFSNLEQLLDPLTHRFKFRSLEAVTFAAYFAAVTSMSSQECLTHLDEERDILLARYRRITEAALVQANFLNSLEIHTLQAFTIYIVVQRSLNRGQFNWTMIGLAMRIAHGFGLHQDGDGRAFSAFEAEMRRRTWWQILALDMKASEDRGIEAILTENSFNTTMPCNLNDEDLKYDSQHPLHGRTGPTEMSLCLLSMDAQFTAWKINSRSPVSEQRHLTLQGREDLVKKYAKRVELTYLANCDFSDQRTRLLRTMGHYWIHKLWLNLYYPLHQTSSGQTQSGTKGLQTAVELLSVRELIEQHPSSADFAWLFHTYVPWHALAVILAELCTKPQGRLSDRAWEIIEHRFKNWNSRVVDIKEAMLWGPINKLLKRARAARHHSRELSANQLWQPASLNSIPQDYDVSIISDLGLEDGKGSSGFDPLLFNDPGLIDQTTGEYQPPDFHYPSPINISPTIAESSNPFNSLHTWDDFMFDVNALNEEIPLEPHHP